MHTASVASFFSFPHSGLTAFVRLRVHWTNEQFEHYCITICFFLLGSSQHLMKITQKVSIRQNVFSSLRHLYSSYRRQSLCEKSLPPRAKDHGWHRLLPQQRNLSQETMQLRREKILIGYRCLDMCSSQKMSS